jgi:hypothetical protein
MAASASTNWHLRLCARLVVEVGVSERYLSLVQAARRWFISESTAGWVCNLAAAMPESVLAFQVQTVVLMLVADVEEHEMGHAVAVPSANFQPPFIRVEVWRRGKQSEDDTVAVHAGSLADVPVLNLKIRDVSFDARLLPTPDVQLDNHVPVSLCDLIDTVIRLYRLTKRKAALFAKRNACKETSCHAGQAIESCRSFWSEGTVPQKA